MDEILNNKNDYKVFQELKRVFEETFEIKTQEDYVLEYTNFRVL